MTIKVLFKLFTGLLVIVALGCSSSEQITAEPNDEKVVIVDRNGREWDISHAVKKYNMKSEYFNFGIGLGSIPSVDSPIVVEEDSREYPDDNFSVFGVNHNEEQRAYSVWQMTRHEVFNEKYPGKAEQHVSVAY